MAWAPDYVSIPEFRSYLRIPDDDDDPELGLALTTASRAIDQATDRQFGTTTSEARTYEVQWARDLGLYTASIDDVMTVAGLVVTVDGVTVDSADWRLEPRNASQKGRPWEELLLRAGTRPSLGHGLGTVSVTAVWGWTSVPVTIKEATMVQAHRFFKRRDSPFGVAGSPDMGSELRLLAKVDPDVAVMVRPFKRFPSRY